MASAQCYRTCEQSCQQQNHHQQQQQHHHQQQQQHSSIGQKISGLFGHRDEGTQTKTQCYKQTEVIYQPGHVAKNQTSQCTRTNANHVHAANGTTTTAANCQGKNRRVREHKRNMFQRIKDGVSGHSSDSGSSSDESDSDNENRRNRKASIYIIDAKKMSLILNNLIFFL
jgi:hypothetical protein